MDLDVTFAWPSAEHESLGWQVPLVPLGWQVPVVPVGWQVPVVPVGWQVPVVSLGWQVPVVPLVGALNPSAALQPGVTCTTPATTSTMALGLNIPNLEKTFSYCICDIYDTQT